MNQRITNRLSFFLRKGRIMSLCLAMTGLSQLAHGQCGSTTGIKTVGVTGNYTTLGAAISDLSINGFTGSVVLELQPDYALGSEVFPFTIPAFGCITGNNTVTIRPAASVSTPITIAGLTTSVFTLDNAKNIVIDGRPGGVGATSMLTVNSQGDGFSAFSLINGSNNDTLRYLNIIGNSSIATVGLVNFGSSDNNIMGNSYNAILNNTFSKNSSATVAACISSNGSTTVNNPNTRNVIAYNDFHDFSTAAAATVAYGINMSGATAASVSKWYIYRNNFYQTIANPVNQTTVCIFAVGDSTVIRSNYIGGNAPLASGTWVSNTTASSNTQRVFPIQLVASINTLPMYADSNVITGFNYISGYYSASTLSGSFAGILANGGGGPVCIGVNDGNLIGSMSSTNAIRLTHIAAAQGTVYGGGLMGINCNTSGSSIVKNNKIGGLTITGNTAGLYCNIGGIANNNVSATSSMIASNNIVGGDVAQSIVSGTTTTTAAANATGIFDAGAGSSVISNNIVRNIAMLGAGAASSYPYGIYVLTTNTLANADTVKNNEIYNLYSSTGTGCKGIRSGTTYATIIGNNIHDLEQAGNASSSTEQANAGIYTSSSSGTTTIAYNAIQNLRRSGTATTVGINMGINANTAALYKIHNNTIVLDNMGSVGAAAVGIKLPTMASASSGYTDLKNNIININSTLPTNTCLWRASTSAATPPANAGFDGNNNIYYINPQNGNYLYLQNNSSSSLATPTMSFMNCNTCTASSTIVNDANFNTSCSNYKLFMAAAGSENTTFTENVSLTGGSIYPNNLQPNPSGISFAQNGGISLDYSTDILGNNIGSTPDIGAIEFSTGSVAGDAAAPTITYTAATILPNTANTCVQPTVSIAIADNVGVNTSAGTLPRIWYKKGSLATGNQNVLPLTNDNTTDGWKWVEATNTASPFSFTFDYSKIFGGATNGDTIYYFVLAQDGNANVGSNTVSFAAGYCPNSVALQPAAFPLVSVTNKYALIGNLATATASATVTNVCGTSTSSVLSISQAVPNGNTIKWQSSAASAATWTDVASATSTSYTTGTLTSDTSFRCLILDCNNNVTATSNTLSIAVNNPNIVSNTPTTICVGTQATLQAASEAGSTIKWYANASGGSSLGSGNSFVTPILNTTTSYYAEASQTASAGSVGRDVLPSPSASTFTGNSSTTGTGFRFSALTDIVVDSLGVWAKDTVGGQIVIKLLNSSSVVLRTDTIQIPAINQPNASNPVSETNPLKRYIPLNYSVSTGTNYRICGYAGTTMSLAREQSLSNPAGAYPYQNSIISINSNVVNGATNLTQVYFFYNVYASSGCVNPIRQQVTATVTPSPLSNLPDTSGTCNGTAATLNSTSANTTWTPTSVLYTNVAATTSYTGGALQTVYAKVTTPTTVYATTTSGSCTFNDSVYVDLQTGTAVDVTATIPNMNCGAATTVALTSNVPVIWSIGAGNLYIDAGATIAYTGTTASNIYAKANNNRFVTGAYETSGCTFADSALITVSNPAANPALANNSGAGNTDSSVVSGTAATLHNADCELMATLTPTGGSPLSGWVSGKIFMDGSVQNTATGPYVTRHFELTPANNASTATANITLYFTQAEFDAYNTYVTTNGNSAVNPLLPSNPSGSTANILIDKFNAASGSPSPTNNNSAVVITPTSVTWDATNNWWAVTFPTTGFSGFYLHTNVTATPLPIVWTDVTASLNEKGQAAVNWTVSEKATIAYQVQKSNDGQKFEDITTVKSLGDGQHNYNYTEAQVLNGKAWYRVAQKSINGNMNYSKIMTLQNSTIYGQINIYPNPATQVLNVEVEQSASYSIYDLQGKIVMNGSLLQGKNALNISALAKGFYTIRIGEYVQKFVLN